MSAERPVSSRVLKKRQAAVNLLIAWEMKQGTQMRFPFTVYNRLQDPVYKFPYYEGYNLAQTDRAITDQCLSELLDIVGVNVNFRDGALAKEIDIIIEEGERDEEGLVDDCFHKTLKLLDVDLIFLHPLKVRQIDETIEKYFWPRGPAYVKDPPKYTPPHPWAYNDSMPYFFA